MSDQQKLDIVSADPLYRQLLTRLKNAILSGEYPVNSRMPSEKELCESYGISRVTVRRALKELTEEGLIHRHQGKGSFVTRPRLEHNLGQRRSFTEMCRQLGRVPGAKVISVEECECGEMSRRFLKLQEGDHVIEITRVRLADGEPVTLERMRLPMSYSWLMHEDLSGSLYELLAAHGVHAGKCGYEISLTAADELEARELELPEGGPLLKLNELICDQSGNPLHLCSLSVRGDRFTLRI